MNRIAWGERIWCLARLFNLKAGMPKDENLPRRFKEEPLPDGPAVGHRFTDADIVRLLSEYYALGGWDENGVPNPETITRLGLAFPRAQQKARTCVRCTTYYRQMLSEDGFQT
jgi:aldehyde:ferredoxin oxidoreductase